jgi:DNA-binding MarR family transcriptional regulator
MIVAMDGEVERFLESWDALVQAIRRARGSQVAPSINGRGLTLSQYGLLQPLTNGDRARVSALSSDAGIAPSTASRILDVLERRELIRRDRHAGDRRGVEVSLTARGRELLADEDEWLRGRQRDFYARLPHPERALAPDLLNRLAALIDELAAGPSA